MGSIDVEGQEAEVARGVELDVAGFQSLDVRPNAQPEPQIVAAVGSNWKKRFEALLD